MLTKKDLYYLIIFFILVVIFFQANIIYQKVFCFRDIGRYYYPARFFVTEQLINGTFPFWNPYIFCGYPVFASLQQATLYPLSLGMHLFPFFTGFNYYFILHFIISGVGIYLLLRYLSLSRFSCLIGSLVYVFGGYLVSMLNLLTTLTAVAWLPFALLLLLAVIKRFRRGYLVSLAFVLALQFYSGQPEIVFLSIFVLFLYLIYFSRQQKDWLVLRKASWWLAICFVLFLLLVSVQLIPFLELLKNSIRENANSINNTIWSFHPLESINFILPSFTAELFAGSSFWFGQSWLRSGYLGIITVLLVCFGAMNKDKNVKYFNLLAGLGLMLALGRYLPGFTEMYDYLPGFSLIRYPVKYLAVFYFATALLAGYGTESVLRKQIERKRIAVVLIILILVLLLYSGAVYYKTAIYAYLDKIYFSSLTTIEKYIFYHQSPGLIRDLLMTVGLLSGWLIILSLWAGKRIGQLLLKTLLVILLIVSLFYGNYQSEPVAEQKYYTLPVENVFFLKERLRYGRMYLSPKSSSAAVRDLSIYPKVDFVEDFYKRQKAVLPNLPVVNHFFSLDGYESIKLKNNEHIIDLISSRPLPQVAKYLDLLGVKYLLSFYPVEWKPLIKVRDDYITFYENSNARDRIQFFDQVTCLSQPAEIDRILSKNDFDPSRELILTGAQSFCPVPLPAGNSLLASGNILSYEGNRVEIQAKTAQEVWFLLADTYYPGWHAQVNGQPAFIYQADYMLRALRLSAGENRIVFSFLPSWFWLGLIITLTVLIVLSLYGGSQIKRFIHSIGRQ